MSKKFRIAIFKLIDILVIFTMVSASPMSITAAAMAQEAEPTLVTDLSEYAAGEAARITGSGFPAGNYILAANGPDGVVVWETILVDDTGEFAINSPALNAAGDYEVRAYPSGWEEDWEEIPVASASFTITAPPLPTEIPTEEPTNTPTDEPTLEPTQEPTNTATSEPTATSTAEPTATPTNEPTATPTAQPTSTTEPTSTATLQPITEPTTPATPIIESGQADYPQGALVTLTGSNWQGDDQVRIIVNDDIGQTWRRDVTVTVAEDGTISDSFSLPTFFVATFNVTARGLQTDRVATTSFTDAPKITAKDHEGQRKPTLTYTSGNITTYQEGDYINFRFTLSAGEASSGQLQVRFTGNDGTCLFFDGSFALGTHDNSAPAIQTVSGATPTVTTVGAPVATDFGTSNGEWVQTLNITFSAAGEAVVNYYVRLSDQAGECNGSSQHSRLNPAGGDVGQSGQQNVPVPANQIVELPEITVTKRIDRDGDGTFDSTATAGEFCFSLDAGTCVSTNSSGQVVFTNVTPNGAHTITETQLNFSQGTYSFVSGSGTNCTFSGSTATATVASGTVATDAACTFNNAQQKGTITITKDSVPDDPQDFSFTTTGTGLSSFSLDDDTNNTLANTRTFTNLNPGSYTVTEGEVAGWSLTGLSCSDPTNNTTTNLGTRTASINVGAGETVTCTFTNTLQQGTLIVKKVVVNDNGGTKTASDFSFQVNGGSAVAFEADGQNDLTVSPGTYSVTEPAVSGYTTTYNNCANVNVPPGGSATCTITNDDQAATLIVIKHVINDNGGTATAADFTLDSGGANDSPDNFAGEESPGTTVTLDAGSYNVTETGPSGYTASYSADCSGTIANGQTKTCTVTNDDNAATLIVIKHVTNDNGGIKTAGDFTMSVTGTDPSPASFAGEEAPGTTVTLNAGFYSVSETGPSGYAASYSADCSGTIANGQTKTCTVTNDDQPGTLIVKKVVINNNGGTATADDFSFEVNGGTATTFEADGQNDLTVNAGTYTVTEPAVAGYSTTYDNCTDVIVPNGGSATCTITNDDQSATLIVKKVVVNNNGGTLEADDFSFSVNGGSAVAFEADGQNDLTVNAGIYSVTEPAVSGYSTTYDDCSNLVIPNGGTATCTITNNDQPAHLELVKVVSNDNGGTAVATDFTLSAHGPTPISGAGGAEGDVSAGTYTLSETSVPGYTAGAWSCEGGTQNNNQITLANGESVTCTITNHDTAPSLTLVKVVVNDNGGIAETTDFMLSANGPTPISGLGGASSDASFQAGTYTLSETGPSGYSASTWSCLGGTQNGSDITLAVGESATCTISNDDDAPSLTLVKEVVNDNGGTAVATDFTLSANGPTPISGAGGATSDDTFEAGTYDLSETSVLGYTASDWVCTGATQGDENTVTIGLGEQVTCTITNDDNAPSLTLVKAVVNDNGGTATAAQWTLTASGPTGFSGAGPSVSSDANFDAGTYDLSENGPAGYTASDWVCDGGTQNGAEITLANGELATCTITNTDNAPSLTLVKEVVNDNGGTAVAANFTLSADGPTPISGAGGASSDASFDAGTYDLSETNVPGYTASAWSCQGGTQNGAEITLGLGESTTCTITNDDDAPSLTLVKQVINDNGGTAVAMDFTLSANGPTPISGAGGATSDATFDAGTYDLSETGPAGYSASDWVCQGGTQDDADTLTLGLGESATCTITNDDQSPSLTLVKVATNNDGGDAIESDWTLTATGPTGFSGPGPSVSNDASFDAGTYDLSESGPAGYTASDWLCQGGTQADGDTVTVGLGESVTCTITNDDIAPTLKLIKVVSNDDGGNASPDDWVLYAIASAPDDVRNFSNSGGSGDFETVFANVGYDLSESVVAGYTAGSWSCTGGTLVDSTLTLGEGETGVTCTITNDDSAPTLTLIKTVVNADGGDAVVADFPLFINGNPTVSGQSNILSANVLYTASETTQPGYTASAWGGDCNADGTITLNEGQNATCTITNDDVAPTLKLVKVVNNDNGGNAVANDWTLSAAAAAPFDGRNFSNAGGSGDFEMVFANAGYDLSETSLPGYTAGAWSCDGGTLSDSTITLSEGENVTCTITNNDAAPTLTIIKVVVNDDGGNAEPDDFNLTIGSNAVTSGTAYTLDANTPYTIDETQLSGYTFVGITGDPECPDVLGGTVSLDEGENVTCTITNDDVAPTLTLIKSVINDHGGGAEPGDFSLTIGGTPATSGTAYALDSNTPYAINETLLPGYSFVSITGDPKCPEVLGGTVMLDEGENVTCTITNTDQPATLIIIKHVVNDNGGTAQAGNFTLDSGGVDDSPDDLAGQEAPGTTVTLDAGAYNVTETGPAGYSASFSADCSGSITNGETKTCTVTNDDIQPQLIIIKHVINDNGGTATAANFTMTVTGNNPNPASFPGAESPGTMIAINAGSYNVSETGLSGYAASFSADCTGSIAVGQTKTCTVTNNDIAPTLRVIKILLPSSDTGKFNLRIDGVVKAANVGNNGTTGPVAVNVGAHTVSETAGTGTSLSNYVTTIGGDCNPDGTINLALGESKTCIITNARRGTIIVEKQTNPNAAPGLFTFTGTAAGTIADNGTITVNNLAPGTYTSTEADPSSSLFVLTSIVCNDGSSANPSTGNVTTRTATFKLDPGETVRCVFTNTKDFHAGTIGFWMNWRNHYTSAQAQLLINYLKSNNPKIYNKDLIVNNADDFTIAKWDAIFNVGNGTPREQMILAQFTALKLNLAITQLDGTSGLVQKNDDICTAGTVSVASISGAASFFGSSTPTVGQIVNAVESRWTGNLTTNRNNWTWNLTSAQKDMLIKVITGINEGTLVMSSGCS